MVYDREYITQSARETEEVGRSLAVSLKSRGERNVGSTVVCLYGELGSGKTTFVQGFAQSLGIAARLPSPTFIIVRRYKFRSDSFFYHIDLYRMIEEDIGVLGLTDILTDPSAYIAVEWAEKLGALLPSRRTEIQFTYVKDGSRKIRIKSIK